MMPRVKHLKKADAALLSQCVALEQACFSDPWSERLFSDILDSPAAHMLVAVDEKGYVLGYFVYTLILDEADIDNVATAPAHRRQGIGGLLLRTFIAENPGVSAYLEVRASNAPAQALYRKHGFAACGVRRDYYEHPAEDAVLMRRVPAGGKEEVC